MCIELVIIAFRIRIGVKWFRGKRRELKEFGVKFDKFKKFESTEIKSDGK